MKKQTKAVECNALEYGRLIKRHPGLRAYETLWKVEIDGEWFLGLTSKKQAEEVLKV